MAKINQPTPGGDVQADALLRRDAARQASTAGLQTSPPALEATLATISAEVMAEALERLQRQAKT